jgi:hypothetical protein
LALPGYLLNSVPNIRRQLWSLNYALHDTNAAWIFQGDDGVLIKIDLLPLYIRELARLHDPLTESLIREFGGAHLRL